MQTEWSPDRNDEPRGEDAPPAPDLPPDAGRGDAVGDPSAVGDGPGVATAEVPPAVNGLDVDGPEGEEEAHRSAADAVDELLDEVELALARLDDGTYGRCETCGAPIDDTELAAQPLVRVCRPCSSGVPALEDA